MTRSMNNKRHVKAVWPSETSQSHSDCVCFASSDNHGRDKPVDQSVGYKRQL